MDRLRLHLDENVDVAVAEGLRRHGIDVTIPSDVGLASEVDVAHIAYCLDEHRIIVTHDPDFLRLHQTGIHHAGIVFCAMGARSIGDMIRSLVLIAEILAPDDMTRSVEFI